MSFKSISQRVSMFAVLGLLPLAAVAAEVREPSKTAQEGTQLIGRMENVARNIHQNAESLNSFARTGHVSASTHKNHLMQIRSLMNEEMAPTLGRLTAIQQDLPEWQQNAIDQMAESVRALAAHANSAILSMNENGNRPVVINVEYRESVSKINEHADFVVKTADAAGDYAAAHQKATEAGLTVPTV